MDENVQNHIEERMVNRHQNHISFFVQLGFNIFFKGVLLNVHSFEHDSHRLAVQVHEPSDALVVYLSLHVPQLQLGSPNIECQRHRDQLLVVFSV